MIFKISTSSKAIAYICLIAFFLLITQSSFPQGVNLQKKVEDLLREGIELYRICEYSKAIEKFSPIAYISKDKKILTNTYFYLSLCHFALGDSKSAKEEIKKVLEIDSTKEISSIFYPPGYVKIFYEVRGEIERVRLERIKREKEKPKTKVPEEKPVVKAKPGEKVKKTGKSFIYVIVGLAVAGGAAAALLMGRNGGTPSGPTTGSIQVNSTPTGAKLYLDGNDTGKTTNTTLANVTPGSHTVKLVKEGYIDYEKSISVTAGQTVTVNASLTKHTITVTSPTSSSIWEKGKEVDIKWETDVFLSYKRNAGVNIGLNPVLDQRSNLSLSFHKRLHLLNSSFRGLMKGGRELNAKGSYKKDKACLKRASRDKNFSEGISSYPGGNIHISKRPSFIAPRLSSKEFRPLWNTKILILTKVKIELYKGNTRVETIESNTENDGTYRWQVPTTLAEGSDYKVRISCASESGIYGETDQFRISSSEVLFEEDWKNGVIPTSDWNFVDNVIPSHGGHKASVVNSELFINAWNDWTGGCGIILKHGYGYNTKLTVKFRIYRVRVHNQFQTIIHFLDSPALNDNGQNIGNRLFSLGAGNDNIRDLFVLDKNNNKISLGYYVPDQDYTMEVIFTSSETRISTNGYTVTIPKSYSKYHIYFGGHVEDSYFDDFRIKLN